MKYCIGYLYIYFCFNILQNLIDSILLIFSIITPVFSLTWSFSYSNISYYYQSWKRFSAVSFKKINLETMVIFSGFFDE